MVAYVAQAARSDQQCRARSSTPAGGSGPVGVQLIADQNWPPCRKRGAAQLPSTLPSTAPEAGIWVVGIQAARRRSMSTAKTQARHEAHQPLPMTGPMELNTAADFLPIHQVQQYTAQRVLRLAIPSYRNRWENGRRGCSLGCRISYRLSRWPERGMTILYFTLESGIHTHPCGA